jgi:hypothetical protein
VPLVPMAPVRRSVSPFPPALWGQELRLVEGDVRLAQEVDGPSQCVGQDRQGLAFAVLSSELRQVLLGWRVVLEKEHRRFRERPLKMGVLDLLAAGAMPFTRRLPGALDQAGVGDARLGPGEAGENLDRVEQHQGQDVADPRDGAQARQRHRIMAVSGLLAGALQRGEQRIVTGDQGQVYRDGLLHAGVIEALEAPAAVLGLGNAAPGGAEVRLAAGILEVRLPLGSRVHEMIAAAEEIARGAHPARVDVSLRNEASAQQRRNVVGIHAVVLGCAAVNRSPVEGMAQDEGNPFSLAEIGEPGPR